MISSALTEKTLAEDTSSSFSFGATIKTRSQTSSLDLLGDALPGVSTITLRSRNFPSYEECLGSCTQLMNDVVSKLNVGPTSYKLGTEVNPIYSGQVTLSKDWAPGEVCRLWIYDRSMEKMGQISAIGQARIFGSISLALNHLN